MSRVRNQKGVALVMAVTTMALLTYLAMEVMYDSNVEYTVNSQALNRLKAYYAARAGMELSLLRIKIYQQVMNKFNPAQMGDMQNYINMIWQFPFSWPLAVPKELDSVDSDSVKKLEKASLMDASISTGIEDEGSKIDLNDLNSPSKTLADVTKKRLLEIFERKLVEDAEFQHNYGGFRFDEMINNIADWMSSKNASVGGGDKHHGYDDLNKDSVYFPPNRMFRSVQEMRMVALMNDEFFDMLAPQITIYGMRGVNPNVSSKQILMSLDRGITSDIADQIVAHIHDSQQGGLFKTADEFWEFVEQKAGRLQNPDAKKIPLYFDALTTFRIKATGEFGGALREIEVIVTDINKLATRIKKFVDDDKKDLKNPPPKTPAAATTNSPLPNGPPRIVYWMEK